MKLDDTIQAIKRCGLSALRRAGAFQLARDSGWRRERLVILCYHGISLHREHRWRPLLYVSQDFFRRRLELLRDGGFNVLPLDEAIRRLVDGSLPERSVVLTFDDGFYDFYARAFPVLEELGYPATVYLSTYYCLKERPVYPLILDYVLWRAEADVYRDVALTGENFTLDLRTETSRRETAARLQGYAERRDLDDLEKQELVRRVAEKLNVDYASIRRQRFAQLMHRKEVEELAGKEIDFQLHTHRHRSPSSEDEYREEIQVNRTAIESITGDTPVHFCYPSGACHPRFAEWLRREGVATAVTDWPGTVSADTDPMFLPRVLDHSGLSESEFLAWVTGLASWLPHRRP